MELFIIHLSRRRIYMILYPSVLVDIISYIVYACDQFRNKAAEA